MILIRLSLPPISEASYFGRIQIIESEEERMYAASLLGGRYNPGDDAGLHRELEKGLSHMLVLRLDIEHMTGKEAIELVRKKWLICFQRAEWVGKELSFAIIEQAFGRFEKQWRYKKVEKSLYRIYI